jgi:hypothetical protein
VEAQDVMAIVNVVAIVTSSIWYVLVLIVFIWFGCLTPPTAAEEPALAWLVGEVKRFR